MFIILGEKQSKHWRSICNWVLGCNIF